MSEIRFCYYFQGPNATDLHAEARPEDVRAEGAGGPRPLRDTEIARGVENLMAAMRDLLNTLSYRGPQQQPGTGQHEENEAGEGDWDRDEDMQQ